MTNSDKIIIALDTYSLNKAKRLVRILYPKVKFFKIGLELVNTGQAPELIKYINKLGGKVFYDTKLNDIANTVEKTAKVISKLGVWCWTIHASAGEEAIGAAVKNRGRSKIFGVTVLTSFGDSESKIIFGTSLNKKVLRFVDMLLKKGVDGIVCSAAEARLIRRFYARGGSVFDRKNLKIITPGIRPVWADKNEQNRIATPIEAIKSGADYLVIGRPITNPPRHVGSALRALDLILKEISG